MNRLLRRQWSLSVGTRLVLGLLPALLAVALVGGLSYWGEYGHQVPRLVVAASAVLAVLSLAITAWNVGYLVNRFDRITELVAQESSRGTGGAPSAADEFDRIEAVVGHLGSALMDSEQARARLNAESAARLREQSLMLGALVRDAIGRLDDVRMPLHILLEAKFGDLNENQEELLRDARAATDDMDAALRRLGFVADADRGAVPVTAERVPVNDVVRSILPMVRSSAERHGARVHTDLEPALPAVRGDRARIAEALALLGEHCASAATADTAVTVATQRDGSRVAITLAPAAAPTDGDLTIAAANRLLRVQGGDLAYDHGSWRITVG